MRMYFMEYVLERLENGQRKKNGQAKEDAATEDSAR